MTDDAMNADEIQGDFGIGTAINYLDKDRAEICKKYYRIEQRYNNFMLADETKDKTLLRLLKNIHLNDNQKSEYIIYQIITNGSLPIIAWRSNALDTENSDFSNLADELDRYLITKGY